MLPFGLIVLFFISIFMYIIYSILCHVFVEVGFTRLEASIIVFGSFVFGLVDIPLLIYKKWIIAINVGGALIPIMISLYLIAKKKFIGSAIIGIAIVSFFSYNVTDVTAEGITSTFPLWLIPPLVASVLSIFASYKKPRNAAPLAYVTGTLGVLIGADFFHLPEMLRIHAPRLTEASIGGAAIFDMVFLTGITAVLVDSFLIYKK